MVYYVHQDHLGSTVAVSDAEGQAVGRVQYDPWGTVLSSTLPVTLTDRLFTEARFDGTIGLYQMGARWYDPALGRWMQADSMVPELGNPQALNRYAYVYNNPLRYTDPSGHCIPGVNCPGDLPESGWRSPSGYRPGSTEEYISYLLWLYVHFEREEAGTGGTVAISLSKRQVHRELFTLLHKYTVGGEELALQARVMGIPLFAVALGSLAGGLTEDVVLAAQQAAARQVQLGQTTYQRWRPEDPINAPTRYGYPSWSTVRRRWRINEALNNSGKWSEENLARMRRNLAPLHPKTGEPLHLHHISGRGGSDPHNPANIMPLWESEHYRLHYGGR